jgi:hypothetical protein
VHRVTQVLELNGFATGAKELPPSKDVLGSILFEKP